MDMLDYSAYSSKVVQECMGILEQHISQGVTDAESIHRDMSMYISKKYVAAPLLPPKRGKMAKYKLCPSCRKRYLRRGPDLEKLIRIGCKCGYSEVIK